MNAGMKMLMISNARKGGSGGENRRGGGRSEMRNEMRRGMENEMEMGYGGMESRRRRDSRGRFRSEMENEMGGGYSEMEMRRGGSGGRSEMEGGYGGMEMESRNGGYGRNEMESRGGYGRNEMRGGYGESEMRSEMRGGYPYRPFPVYEGGDKMNQIGFSAGGNEVETNYRMIATHNNGNEMEYRKSPTMGGYSHSKGTPMTREMAEEWVHNMRNEDGTKGAHWTMEQAKQVMAQKGIEYNPVEFWAILNALYSDYASVLKKWNMAKMDFFVDLACAWLNDTDAVPNKASAYYEHVVKK